MVSILLAANPNNSLRPLAPQIVGHGTKRHVLRPHLSAKPPTKSAVMLRSRRVLMVAPVKQARLIGRARSPQAQNRRRKSSSRASNRSQSTQLRSILRMPHGSNSRCKLSTHCPMPRTTPRSSKSIRHRSQPQKSLPTPIPICGRT